jgi:carbonic anhydrase
MLSVFSRAKPRAIFLERGPTKDYFCLMSNPLSRLLILSVSIAFYGCQTTHSVDATSHAHWGYEGEMGPEYWGSLSPEFLLCEHGVNQSPLDIQRTIAAELQPISFNYTGQARSVINNGHTLQVDVDPGSFMRIGDERFDLTQLHFHSPSEHHIRGESFPLEAHFVHQNAEGQLAVSAVMFRLGEDQQDLAEIGKASTIKAGEANSIELDMSRIKLHPSQRDYFRYSGSLTTPPCTEGVAWFILKEAGHISQKQVDRFVSLIGEDARGIQPQNARIVVEH